MKANELMIGDWVSYIGKDFNDFADKISGIIDGYVTLDKEMIHRSIDKIHPIPLTAEILMKNGFVEFIPHNWQIVIDNIMIELHEPEHNMAIWLDWNEKQGNFKMVDANKVIEWLNDQACLGWIEDVEINKFIDKFKKDFKL